jgi:replicative DNA helicase
MTWECAVGLATLEMSGRKIFKRLSYFTSPERFNELADLFWVCESSSDFQELLKIIRQMHSQKGIRVIMIDYLQLIFARGNFKTRHQEISYMIRQLKNLAKETGLVVIVVSTLGRSIEHREKKNARPILSDLKESGDIEFCVDVALFLHRKEDADTETELIIAKNRDGVRGTCTITWNTQKVRYDNRIATG